MAEIALLGYGTVGSGVVEVLKKNQLSINKRAFQPIQMKYIFDLRDFKGDAREHLITHDIDDILNDNDVKVIVEAMGGVEPAYTYVKKALLRGKSVVTSNKELVARHGAELLEIARERNLNFLFEASVGGGIPIIRPLNQCLTADEITEIMGILNGTTNFILTKMSVEGRDFDEVLKEAQELGYAERDPAADVEGHDTCRKIAILLSLAFGRHVDFEDIAVQGITNITKQDILYAKELNMCIKLLATAKKVENKAFASVAPVMIPCSHPLAMVQDVFNAIFVKGNVIDEVMFYGRGAGKLPTASAVVADVVDAVRNLNHNIMHFWSSEKVEIIPIDRMDVELLVRVVYRDKERAVQHVADLFGVVLIVAIPQLHDEFAFVTNKVIEKDLQAKIMQLKSCEAIEAIPNVIRLER